jgi:hypothetical protein
MENTNDKQARIMKSAFISKLMANNRKTDTFNLVIKNTGSNAIERRLAILSGGCTGGDWDGVFKDGHIISDAVVGVNDVVLIPLRLYTWAWFLDLMKEKYVELVSLTISSDKAASLFSESHIDVYGDGTHDIIDINSYIDPGKYLPNVINCDIINDAMSFRMSEEKSVIFKLPPQVSLTIKFRYVIIPKFWEQTSDKRNPFKIDMYDLLSFLKDRGFHRYVNKGGVYETVQIKGYIIKPHDNASIRLTIDAYIHEHPYLTKDEKFHLIKAMSKCKLQDGIFRDSNLPLLRNDIIQGSENHQYMFFKNKTWKVTDSGVAIEEPATGTYVWEEDILGVEHKVMNIQNPFFTMAINAQGRPILTIHRQDHPFLQFLINTSRIHWRKEFDAAGVGYYETNEYYAERGLNTLTGKFLSSEEQEEQCKQFMCKIISIGYYNHTYKNPSIGYAICCVDYDSDSPSRSGKSVFCNAIARTMRTTRLDGISGHRYHFDCVSEKINLLLYDDCPNSFDVSSFYNVITSDMMVDGRFNEKFHVPFSISPRLLFNSSKKFKSKSLSDSRIQYLYFSDFYHGITNRFNRSKSISDDFEECFFDHWPLHREIGFYNIVKDCIVAYLKWNEEGCVVIPTGL